MNYKKKKIIGFLLLLLVLIVLKFFLGSKQLYTIFEELPELIILLLIISIIMTIFPLVIKSINKKRLEFVKGKKICLLNSIILFIIFSIPNINTIMKGPANDGMVNSLDPIYFTKQLIFIYFIIAIIYYFINMCFFVDNKKQV